MRVIAASINAFDWKIAQGMLANNFQFDFPVTIGRDFAGVIVASGDAADGFAIGDAVFGYTTGNRLHHGSLAELLPTGGTCLVRKPEALSFRAAAALPLSGMTAMHCVEPLALEQGQSVLVVGAPGGVGSMIVQLAARAGATVLATGLPQDRVFLADLGAEDVFDHREDLTGAVRERSPDGVDAVIDLVNRGDAFIATARLARPGGTAVSVHRQADPGQLGAFGVRAINASGIPADPIELALLGELAASGELTAPIAGSFPLEQAVDGLAHIRDNHVCGKYVIDIGAAQ
jgi:NADPH:quinone reductase-like Zn-dependent oxidoreductase